MPRFLHRGWHFTFFVATLLLGESTGCTCVPPNCSVGNDCPGGCCRPQNGSCCPPPAPLTPSPTGPFVPYFCNRNTGMCEAGLGVDNKTECLKLCPGGLAPTPPPTPPTPAPTPPPPTPIPAPCIGYGRDCVQNRSHNPCCADLGCKNKGRGGGSYCGDISGPTPPPPVPTPPPPTPIPAPTPMPYFCNRNTGMCEAGLGVDNKTECLKLCPRGLAPTPPRTPPTPPPPTPPPAPPTPIPGSYKCFAVGHGHGECIGGGNQTLDECTAVCH
jgi:hypothetical protein